VFDGHEQTSVLLDFTKLPLVDVGNGVFYLGFELFKFFHGVFIFVHEGFTTLLHQYLGKLSMLSDVLLLSKWVPVEDLFPHFFLLTI
jgi:hypothetical protein